MPEKIQAVDILKSFISVETLPVCLRFSADGFCIYIGDGK
ncbi:hypothetical protein BSM4216_1755 [Bacillus smithii]|nr:hypothetical protein BSM4216_1755 [Bacillus smithii]